MGEMGKAMLTLTVNILRSEEHMASSKESQKLLFYIYWAI